MSRRAAAQIQIQQTRQSLAFKEAWSTTAHEGAIQLERLSGGGSRATNRAPRYLPVQSPLSKCLLWTRLAANWLQLTLYQDELESEHETFPSGKKMEESHTHTQTLEDTHAYICK